MSPRRQGSASSFSTLDPSVSSLPAPPEQACLGRFQKQVPEGEAQQDPLPKVARAQRLRGLGKSTQPWEVDGGLDAPRVPTPDPLTALRPVPPLRLSPTSVPWKGPL